MEGLKLSLGMHIMIVLLVAVAFMFYMELLFIPHFYIVKDYGLTSFPPTMRNDGFNRFINAGGVLLFVLSFFGGRELIYLLESLKDDGDRLGCIRDFGRYKEK